MPSLFLSLCPQDALEACALAGEFAFLDIPVDFYDGPFPDFDSPQAAQARRAIGEKIAASRITLCLISEHTHQCPWVNCQLEKTRQKGSRIIAMARKGVKVAALPAVIREENLKFYPWDPARLAKLLVD